MEFLDCLFEFRIGEPLIARTSFFVGSMSVEVASWKNSG